MLVMFLLAFPGDWLGHLISPLVWPDLPPALRVTAPESWLTVISREGSPGNLDTSTLESSQHPGNPAHTKGIRRPDPVRPE